MSAPAADIADGVAIVGMAGRFPGARDPAELWRNLRAGVESITHFGRDELVASGVPPETVDDPRYVPAYGALDDIDRFDAELFAYEPREAAVLDPQDRLLLECAWAALEDAGYPPDGVPVTTGVFAGEMVNSYMMFNLASRPDVVRDFGWPAIRILNDKDFLATRVSYKLNLKGPSIGVQTACSTSLVAVHLACESLLGQDCDMALAGGVSLQIPQRAGYLSGDDGFTSRDGRSRAFDAGARGSVGGSGVALVVLRRLEDALADGDAIRAVILGTAVNNDGALKVGYTAPSVDAQSEVVGTALGVAGVDARSIGYVEAHATGTLLGDAVEVAALTQAFRRDTADTGYCALGSIKPNLGHLDHAAGVTSLIKTVLALEHEEIPPSLHYERPNPEIDFPSTPFRVADRRTPWPRGAQPRRACVNSIGVGGTNAHVVVQEAPAGYGGAAAAPVRPEDAVGRWHLLVLSARAPEALERATDALADHLERSPAVSLADAAFTLLAGRTRFEHRRIVLCRDASDAVRALRERDPERVETRRSTGASSVRPAPRSTGGEAEALRDRGRSWLAGADLDPAELYPGSRPRRTPLPTYPFERRRHWIEPGGRAAEAETAETESA